jgi:aminopeptidase N
VEAARLWSPEADRDELLSVVADLCLRLADEGGARQVVALRALAETAVTDEQVITLRDLVNDDIDLGWRMLTRLAALGRLDANDVASLEKRDPNPEAWARALVVEAARPAEEAKQAMWTAVIEQRKLPVSYAPAAGSAFWQPGQDDLLAPYPARYLEALPALREAGVLSVMTTVTAMFPVVGVDRGFADRVDEVANSDTVTPTIASRMLEQGDRLRRMLAARG